MQRLTCERITQGEAHTVPSRALWKEKFKRQQCQPQKNCSQDEHHRIMQNIDQMHKVIDSDGQRRGERQSTVYEQILNMPSKSAVAVEPHFGKAGVGSWSCTPAGCEDAWRVSWGKISVGRTDRKISWNVPVCSYSHRLILEAQAQLGDGSKAKFMAMHVGGGEYAVNRWRHRVQVKVNGLVAIVLEQPVSLIGELPVEMRDDFNLWVDLSDSSGYAPQRPRQVEICFPDKNVYGDWNISIYSPFKDGGGRIDWVAVFYSNTSKEEDSGGRGDDPSGRGDDPSGRGDDPSGGGGDPSGGRGKEDPPHKDGFRVLGPQVASGVRAQAAQYVSEAYDEGRGRAEEADAMPDAEGGGGRVSLAILISLIMPVCLSTCM
eukprot:gnl/TRDRNA2_/TRDRNA2_177183_c1_seq5.p1 gnl/TRDRNA2_/TRDRNA2_177183_c1~~gnl/TRDRNA2_/TRDRNA2_177183_c1_seq5.p1  ORF type:complete len:375 (-),score=37.80 gnl/TRDRNA2_/TRDRNA2_177183_c1_seq5:108-1232(-)